MSNCPLCQNIPFEKYHHDSVRGYNFCPMCNLVFVKPEHLYSLTQEKQIYDCHQNNPNDMAYRKHLSKLATPLIEKLSPQSSGLDFGSGPGPTLSLMLAEQGFKMSIYDPIYANAKSVLKPQQPYNFITMTEVIEHIYHPEKELDMLWDILQKGGWLAIMTSMNEGKEFFKNWHYTKDPTHVRFYSKQTFTWLANKYNAKLEYPCDNVIFLQKQG